MQLSTHFTLAEFTASQWAARAGIENEPGPVELENLKRLAMTMEMVRYALGAPILITSGYRCPEVNRHVGGSSTSMHVQGLAADFIAPGFGTPYQVAQKLLSVEAIKFDQLIHEYGRWVHLGLAVTGKEPRLQALSIFSPGRYLPGIVEKQ
jgi:zinc D-Ala-D-Ala carboxypeptidase